MSKSRGMLYARSVGCPRQYRWGDPCQTRDLALCNMRRAISFSPMLSGRQKHAFLCLRGSTGEVTPPCQMSNGYPFDTAGSLLLPSKSSCLQRLFLGNLWPLWFAANWLLRCWLGRLWCPGFCGLLHDLADRQSRLHGCWHPRF